MPALFAVFLAVVIPTLAYLFRRSAESKTPAPLPDGGSVPASRSERQNALRAGIQAAGIVREGWLRFLETTSDRETGHTFNPRAFNDSGKEAAAAKASAQKTGVVGGVDFNDGRWGFGSKGLFQHLGPVVAVESSDTDRDGSRLRFPRSMVHPDMAFDPGVSIAAAFDFARGLMGWSQFRGTWASLAVGWGNPSRMDDAAAIAESGKALEDRAAKLGWPRGWVNEQVDALPNRTAQENATLAEAANFAYKGASL